MKTPVVAVDKPFVARQKGIFLNRRIETGRYFSKLSPEEKAAAIAHEEGHLFLKHALRRVWWACSFKFLNPNKFFKEVQEQEFEADAYAARKGHALGLVSILSREHARVLRGEFDPKSDPLHPAPIERIMRLVDFNRRKLS